MNVKKTNTRNLPAYNLFRQLFPRVVASVNIPYKYNKHEIFFAAAMDHKSTTKNKNKT